MVAHFKVQEHLDNAPPWVTDIVKIAKAKTRNYGWQDIRSVTIANRQSTFFTLPWSIEFDDMVSEGCLAYLQAIERGKSEAWARESARGKMSELARGEGRAHGYTRDKTGKMALVPVSVHKHFVPGRLFGGGLANSKKTHCNKGHEFTEENTMLGRTKNGGPKRTCRICDLARSARYRAKKAPTHCKYGHELSEENVKLVPAKNNSVKRICKTCGGRKVKKKTHCKKGHEFTAENTYILNREDGTTERYCRACRDERNRKRYLKPNVGGAVQGSSLINL